MRIGAHQVGEGMSSDVNQAPSCLAVRRSDSRTIISPSQSRLDSEGRGAPGDTNRCFQEVDYIAESAWVTAVISLVFILDFPS